MVGCVLGGLGLWGLYSTTVSRVRLMFGRAPRGFTGVLWREQRREDSERAAFWQRVSGWALVVGFLMVVIARSAS
jgi:hypothetical protein